MEQKRSRIGVEGAGIAPVGGAGPHSPAPDPWAVFDAAPSPYLLLAADPPAFTIVAVNGAFRRVAMIRREDMLGRGLFDVFPDDSAGHGARNLRASLERVLATRAADRMALQKYAMRRRGGADGVSAERWWSALNVPVFGADGAVERIIHQVEDVTASVLERQATRSALAESDERLRLVVEGAKDHAIITADPLGRITSWSAGAETIFGWAEAEVVGGPAALFFTPEDRAAGVPEEELGTAREKGCANDERWHLRKDGRRVFMNGSVHPLHDASGALRGFIKIARDETERRRKEAALRESEARFRRAADTAPALLWVTDAENRCTYLSRSWHEYTGQAPGSGLGSGWLGAIHPEDREPSAATFRAAAARREPFSLEYRLRRADGEYRWAMDAGRPHFSAKGGYLGYVGSVIDIQERKAVEEALRESEERYRTLFDRIDAGFCTIELRFDEAGRALDYRFVEVNPAFERQTGLTDAAGKWMRDLAPGHEQHWFDLYGRVALTGEPVRFEQAAAALDGRWFDAYAFRVGGPEARRVAVLFNDISERRRAEEALARHRAELERLVEERTADLLRAAEERRRAQEALRQGEKLQAIGQLTGGIAHDFNNILQVVSSGAQLLKSPRLTDERRAAVLDGMVQAAQNAKALTGRLLAFARKQPLRPETFDLNDRLLGMAELLRGTLGQRVRVATDLEPGLWPVRIDPTQLEVAVLNLAVNARDAMPPEGGTLTLQTRNARPPATSERPAGEYVCLAVKDTGRGMPPAVLARVFEPFFTTKGPDKGTGLGLAQAHGFAKQSGGDISIESAPGEGTSVVLHLPRAAVAEAGAERAAEGRTTEMGQLMERAAGRAVLVVEDNADVAAFACAMLEGLGYATRRAGNAAEALGLLAGGEAASVHAVFSDVVMPGGMSGLDLAATVRQRFPWLAVVLATGYSDALAGWRGALPAEVLRKPYRLEEVAAALERALAPSGAGAAPEVAAAE